MKTWIRATSRGKTGKCKTLTEPRNCECVLYIASDISTAFNQRYMDCLSFIFSLKFQQFSTYMNVITT